MTVEEMKSAIEQLRAEVKEKNYGDGDEVILGAFYRMFQDDKLTIDELDGIVNLMGYHLTDDFKSMSPEDQKTKGYEEVDDGGEGEEKDLPGDKKLVDGGKEVVDSDEPEDKPAEKEDESDKKEDESDEEAKAMKLFGQK